MVIQAASWRVRVGFCVQLAVGHHSFPSLVALTFWWTATWSISGAATWRPLWTTPFLMSASKNCICDLWNPKPLFSDRIHCYSLEGDGASRLDAIEAVSSNGQKNRWSVLSWAPRCREQFYRSVATQCFLSKRVWEKGQWWRLCGIPFSFNYFLHKISSTFLRSFV